MFSSVSQPSKTILQNSIIQRPFLSLSRIVALSASLGTIPSGSERCLSDYFKYLLVFLVLWSMALLTEVSLAAVAFRGSIFDDQPRKAAEYLLYIKLGECNA